MARRGLLATGAAAVAASLFLPFFPGVSGWEHWAWADVVLAALAAALAAAAATGVRRAAVLLPLAALCSLGVAVVLGHGFEPRLPVRSLVEVGAGPYAALAGCAAGAIGALAAWPRGGGRLLLVAGAAGIVAALLSGWGFEGPVQVVAAAQGDGSLVGVLDLERGAPTGFERWHVLDLALVALAAGLLAVAAGLARRAAALALAAGCVLAAACVTADALSRSALWWGDGGVVEGAALGTLAALLSLAAALAGLALRRRAPAARAG
ncbi:MAG TPA: hypothetical protein VGW75_00055 [Solirubrobacteraceae bacterium]|jgi:hypothetical protein|nr:hypothetical protein [Solirubrobacteraceae bacterium]